MFDRDTLVVDITDSQEIINKKYGNVIESVLGFADKHGIDSEAINSLREETKELGELNGWHAEAILRDLVEEIHLYLHFFDQLPNGYSFQFSDTFGTVPGECRIGVLPN